jgi:Clustered mitochondria
VVEWWSGGGVVAPYISRGCSQRKWSTTCVLRDLLHPHIPHLCRVYGSSDAGQSVKHDPRVESRMSQVATHLNIKAHAVRGVMLSGPFDLEAHLAHDGRVYLVDWYVEVCARVCCTCVGSVV